MSPQIIYKASIVVCLRRVFYYSGVWGKDWCRREEDEIGPAFMTIMLLLLPCLLLLLLLAPKLAMGTSQVLRYWLNLPDSQPFRTVRVVWKKRACVVYKVMDVPSTHCSLNVARNPFTRWLQHGILEALILYLDYLLKGYTGRRLTPSLDVIGFRGCTDQALRHAGLVPCGQVHSPKPLDCHGNFKPPSLKPGNTKALSF